MALRAGKGRPSVRGNAGPSTYEWVSAMTSGMCRTLIASLGAVALVLAASVAWLWQSDAAFELKASALATGSLLATPYVFDYDLVVLAVAIAFFARHGLRRGFRDYEISLLAAVWIMPLLSRGIAGVTGIPLGLLVLLTFYIFTVLRAMRDRAGVACGRASDRASLI